MLHNAVSSPAPLAASVDAPSGSLSKVYFLALGTFAIGTKGFHDRAAAAHNCP